MGLRSFFKFRNTESRSILDNPAISLASPAIWQWINQGNPSASGELINEVSALQITTVYACVRVISESIASLPLKLYEKLPKGRQEAADQSLYNLLAFEPNPEMTAFTFFETLTGCLALTGNCYAQIVRNGAKQITALYPLHPLQTTPVRLPDGKLAYTTSDGEQPGNQRILGSDAVLHIPLFGWDGLKGLSPIHQAREGLGLARAAEKFGARFFGNGAKPSGLLWPDGEVDEQQAQGVKESWQASNGGVNQNNIAVIPGKWHYQQVGISPEDSQFLATRKFQREDICGMFRVPPSMVGDVTKLSNNNHEQQSLSFVTDTLRPYLCRFEQEIVRKLMPDTGRNSGKYFVQFDVSERLRGDFKTSMEGYAAGRQWGWFSANDVLTDLGENPIGEIGDIYMFPVNMGNAKNLLNPPPPPVVVPAEQPQQEQEPSSDAPTEAERSLLSRYMPAYLPLFRDAVGRTTARTKRDLDGITTVFSSLLDSLSGLFTDAARTQFKLTDAWKPDTDKLVREHLRGIEKRAADWTPEQSEQSTGIELNKAVRALHIKIFRDAGAAVAITNLGTEVTQ
jgi:HK97 family phage portal protein